MTPLAATEARLAPRVHQAGLRITLLDGFRLTGRAGAIPVSGGAERLLAFMAMRHQMAGRLLVAASLWADATERHAYAALRSTLIRMNPACRDALLVTVSSLELAPGVSVDLSDGQALAHRLLEAGPHTPADLSVQAVAILSSELLPLWYDDWAVSGAEDWRQLRLHALEAVVDGLVAERRFGDATAAAGVVVRADPLRESAHAALIRVHLAEGNQSEAVHAFDRFSRLLRLDLNLAPTSELRELVGGRLGPRPG
ncbi:SARP family transcriptional regulator [Saccharothrix sp. 6-C]|uniref:AfsR/SARP family transcriptional regulator n=1 Tax=Saccharothrix sp. 6-C TaxID=2781735 RepID=UPI0019179033|nr:BTAD domain-containing putative transcriptional regulator [Saccharothrix sp. 6-C]QQQ74171.1 SARP family transcriptional regulator [Saccharothrix sp. 6-C]